MNQVNFEQISEWIFNNIFKPEIEHMRDTEMEEYQGFFIDQDQRQGPDLDTCEWWVFSVATDIVQGEIDILNIIQPNNIELTEEIYYQCRTIILNNLNQGIRQTPRCLNHTKVHLLLTDDENNVVLSLAFGIFIQTTFKQKMVNRIIDLIYDIESYI